LFAPRQTPKLDDHPFSTVRGYLFITFVATRNIWKPPPPRGCPRQWWQWST